MSTLTRMSGATLRFHTRTETFDLHIKSTHTTLTCTKGPGINETRQVAQNGPVLLLAWEKFLTGNTDEANRLVRELMVGTNRMFILTSGRSFFTTAVQSCEWVN